MTNLARSSRVVCSGDQFNCTVLNRYANQRSVSRLKINYYQNRLCYKTNISDLFTVQLNVLFADFSVESFVSRPGYGFEILSPSLSVNVVT